MLKRWLLINYAGLPYSPTSLMPDNGLANLAGALIKNGIKVEILDFSTTKTISKLTSPLLTKKLNKIYEETMLGKGDGNFLKKIAALSNLLIAESYRQKKQKEYIAQISYELVEKIQKEKIQAIGFKLWNGDGIEGSTQIAAYIKKKHPKIKLFGGGPQVDIFMDKILKYQSFDALCYGEGEETIVNLAEIADENNSLFGIPNLLFRSERKIIKTREKIIANLDKLPMPVYDCDIYPAMQGNNKIKIIVIDESRGCFNKCAFCIHPKKSNNQLRTKSIERLNKEIDNLISKYNIHTFRFSGSCTPYYLLNDFALRMISSRKKVTYASFVHVRESEKIDFHTLHDSGCVALFYGLESGSQKILNLMHKGISVTQIRKTIKATKAAGIFMVGSIIYPAPGEDEITMRETLEMLESEKPDACPIQAPIVIPYTSWYNSPDKYSIKFNKKAYLDASFKWKVKFLLPPNFWEDLPIKIGGKKYRQILNNTATFSKRVEKAGIITSLSDDLVLMATRAKINVKEFRDVSRKNFYSADILLINKLIKKINENT